MSILSAITSFFSGATPIMQDVMSGFAVIDNNAGVVLGQAQVAAEVATAFDPAAGAELEAAVVLVTTIRTTINSMKGSNTPSTTVTGQVASYLQAVDHLGVLVAPFYTVAAKAVSDVDAAAVQAARALVAMVPLNK